MTGYLYEAKAAKVTRLKEVLAATNAEVTRLTTLWQANLEVQSVLQKARADLEVMQERSIVLTRELAAANALP